MKVNIEMKNKIDAKIYELGEKGCRKFLEEVEPTMPYAKDWVKAVISELVSENWDELNELFLNWESKFC